MQHTITADTIQSFCRSCLNELQKSAMYNIQAMDVQKRLWLQDSTIQKPPINDSLPMFVCQQCHDKLESFLEFHQMCSRSRQVFLDILKTKCHKKVLKFDFVDVPSSLTEYQVKTYKEMLKELKDTAPSSEDEEPSLINESPVSFDYLEQDEDSTDNDIEIIENSAEDNEDWKYPIIVPSSDHNSTLEEIKSDKTRETTKDTQQKCDNICFSPETMDCDTRVKQGLKPYQCPNCDLCFDTLNQLRTHLNEIHPTLKIICEYEGCAKEFWRSETYRDHCGAKHTPARGRRCKHICEECGKVYSNAYSLKTHQYSHKPKEEYPYHCNVCNKVFVQRRPFEEHQLRHAGIKEFECPYCGLRKTTKYELKNHINYHTKERQWQCPQCPMIFNSSTNFRNHEKVVHQGIKRYHCTYCGQSFGAYHVLKNHKMRHTGEKPNICSECGKSFIQIASLRTHMKMHDKVLVQNTDEKPHICSECGKGFTKTSSLKNHKKMHNRLLVKSETAASVATGDE